MLNKEISFSGDFKENDRWVSMEFWGLWYHLEVKKKKININKAISTSLKLSERGKMKDIIMDLPLRTSERKNRATLSDH